MPTAVSPCFSTIGTVNRKGGHCKLILDPVFTYAKAPQIIILIDYVHARVEHTNDALLQLIYGQAQGTNIVNVVLTK